MRNEFAAPDPLSRSGSDARFSHASPSYGKPMPAMEKAWEQGILESLRRTEKDRASMEDHLSEMRRNLPRLVQIALLEWNQRAEAAAERLRIACKGVLEVARHHHQRLVEQATQWEAWQGQVLGSMSAMSAMAAEQAQAEIAFMSAKIGARFAASVKANAMEMLVAEHTTVAMDLQHKATLLQNAQEEEERCEKIVVDHEEKERVAEAELNKCKDAVHLLGQFRDTVLELVESYSVWDKMREPLHSTTLRFATKNPELRELLDPDDDADGGDRLNIPDEDRALLGTEYRRYEREVTQIKETMQQMTDSIVESLVPRLNQVATELHRAGVLSAQEWVDSLPLPEILKDVKDKGRKPLVEQAASKVLEACDQVVGEVNGELVKAKVMVSRLAFRVARATAMVGTAKAVIVAIQRRKQEAEAEIVVLQAQLEEDVFEGGEAGKETKLAKERERELWQRKADATREWENLRVQVAQRYDKVSQDLVASDQGHLYLRELLSSRWQELKEASAEYQAIREVFWARIHELTGGGKVVRSQSTMSGGGLSRQQSLLATSAQSSRKKLVNGISRLEQMSPSAAGNYARSASIKSSHSAQHDGMSDEGISDARPIMFTTPESLKRPEDREAEAVTNATVRLQAAFRGYKERQQISRSIDAVIFVQRVWRARLRRRELQRAKAGALAAEEGGAKGAAAAEEQKRREAEAATKISKHMKGFLARKEAEKVSTALRARRDLCEAGPLPPARWRAAHARPTYTCAQIMDAMGVRASVSGQDGGALQASTVSDALLSDNSSMSERHAPGFQDPSSSSRNRLRPEVQDQLRLDLSPVLSRRDKASHKEAPYQVAPDAKAKTRGSHYAASMLGGGASKPEAGGNAKVPPRAGVSKAAPAPPSPPPPVAKKMGFRALAKAVSLSAPKAKGESVLVPSRPSGATGVLIPNQDLGRLKTVVQHCQGGCNVTVQESAARGGAGFGGGNPGKAKAGRQEVVLSVSRDLSRLVYKPPAAKVSQFIRVPDITEVEESKAKSRANTRTGTPLASPSHAGRYGLVVRTKGPKEYHVVFGSEDERSLWMECLVILLTNKAFLASLKATVEQADV